jgi:hypothetical protein
LHIDYISRDETFEKIPQSFPWRRESMKLLIILDTGLRRYDTIDGFGWLINNNLAQAKHIRK